MLCIQIYIVKFDLNLVNLVKMSSPTVFEFRAYKVALDHFLRSDGKRGLLTRAAKALHCQPSFLSRVIGSEIHLTPEQAFMICQFLNWSANESEYFQTLVAIERAADPGYKSALTAKLKQLRVDHESLQKRTQKEDFALVEQQSVYLSSWIWSAVHFLSSVPAYQTVEKMADRLGLSNETTRKTLTRLEQWGLVRKTGSRWEYAQGQFHVPKDSPYVVLHHQNWRTRAVLDAQEFQSESLHFTSVYTLTAADVARLRELMLKFISDCQAVAQPSSPEESVVLICDLYKTR